MSLSPSGWLRLPPSDPRHPTRVTQPLLACVSGLLLALALPSADLSLLAWVALIPFFHAITEARPAQAFRLGWLCGFVFHIATLYWIVYTVAAFTPIPAPLAVVPLLAASAVLALYTGVWAAGVIVAGRRGFVPVLFAALWWAGLEWIRSWFFLGGFPWCFLGYALHGHRALVQLAELTGVYGLSALVVLVNAAAFAALGTRGEARRRALQLGGVSLALVAGLQFGNGRLASLQRLDPDRSLHAAIVQGNIPASVKWDEGFEDETLRIYEQLSREVGGDSKALIVWPETAMPSYFQLESLQSNRVRNVARATGAWLLFGSPGVEVRKGEKSRLHNRAWLLSPDGATAGFYDKVQLVPFGEYVPLARFLFFLDNLLEGVGPFEPGAAPQPIAMDPHRLGVLICYEAIFPPLARGLVHDGADVLVNITNDGWFGPTSAPEQHLAMAQLRAVENRVPLLRAANTGISAIVLPDGHIEQRIELDERALRVADLSWPTVHTFYSRFGDVFAVVALGGALVLLGSSVARQFKPG
jgi:apolipoprotein N-acyltransferase